MSTKTTFKRIALVAVAALGFGMLSVVPSQATARTAASIVVGTIPTARTGATVSVPVTIYLPAGTVTDDTTTVNIEVTASPILGGAANAASTFSAGSAGTNAYGALLGWSSTAVAAAGISGASLAVSQTTGEVFGRLPATRSTTLDGSGAGVAGSSTGVYTISAAQAAAGSIKLNAVITPDVAGTYTFLVSTNATAVAAYTAGDVNASFSLTAGSTAPTSVVLTPLAGSSILAGTPIGIPVAVTLVGGSLSGLEAITISASGNSAVSATAGSGTEGTDLTLTKAYFLGGATTLVYLRGTDTAAESVTLTATSSVMSNVFSTTKTFAILAQDGDGTNNVSVQAPSSTSVYASNSTKSDGATNPTYTVSSSSASQKIGFTVPALTTATLVAASGTTGYVKVTDTLGKLTGVSGISYDVPFKTAFGLTAGGFSISFAANLASIATGVAAFTVEVPLGASTWVGPSAAKTITFMTATPIATTFSITPSTTILAAPAAAVALTVKVKDQFNATFTNASVTATTTGRNNPAATALNTGSTGSVVFTTADSSVSTTSLVDTITFTSGAATAGVVTINYANTAVSTVTVTGGNTTKSVTAATVSPNAISAGDGAENGAINITATVKDASANALAGVAVTFTVAGTGVAFKSTSATKYTGSTGTAIGSLYAWIAGTYTYTVTAGGKTTTGTATFLQSTAAEARTISATVSGNVVTGKAVDRFGNPVSGVTLYASTTAPANIAGTFLATGTTGTDGTAAWVVTNSGSVTVSAVNPTKVAGTTFGQTCALAGNIDCAVPGTAAEAFTASTVGTATTAETYVGASIAPAGVASASVTASDTTASDATDAAAEATDAANAATDAANAAAEAADAATAAAQDAADAVAALSAQVATLISGLKAQLTALTNLVIKIQKKVKA